jgi:hypothetical protein
MDIEVKQLNGVWLKALVMDVEEPSTVDGGNEGSGEDKLEVSYVNGPASMQNDWIGLDMCRRQIEGAKAAQQQQKLEVGQTIEVYLARAGWQLAKVKKIKV